MFKRYSYIQEQHPRYLPPFHHFTTFTQETLCQIFSSKEVILN